MLRAVILVLFLLFGHSSADEWKPSKSISMKKDAIETILVKSGSLQRLFDFRWTLYKNGSIVILRSYDGFVAQNILSSKRKNRSFRVELLPRGLDYRAVPYLVVTFKEFDFKKNEALFDIYLSDDDEKILLQYLRGNE
ncbi:MAG: hypothetical protein U9P71_08090 [Campylobacterota bacterium]|nr:hypothetical protein [Campylobacterota bacterium]